MSTTSDARSDIEGLLSAALAARADQVRPEDLSPRATVTPVRLRWRSPWVLLATAAVVLLILGAVFQGLGPDTRSDRLAPKPDAPQLELPTDVGRDWKADDLSGPAKLDLDGDGVDEKVVFLAEPTQDFDGRTRLQTTLSTTGEEAYGIAQLQSTIGTHAMEPIDADDDGDQELVLPWENIESGPEAPAHPLVFDLRDGLLVQLAVEDPELLQLGNVAVPGSRTEFYDLVRNHGYWVEDGQLRSSRSASSFARGAMTVLRPDTIVRDSWRWVLDDVGVLRPVPSGCLLETPDGRTAPCPDGARDGLPHLAPASTSTVGIGGTAEFDEGYRFTARLNGGTPPMLVVEGSDGRRMGSVIDVLDPLLARVQPTSVFSDGASVVVTSESDPQVTVWTQQRDVMAVLNRVGEVPLENTASNRTWLTEDGVLLTAVDAEDDTWTLWQWIMVSGSRITALPWGTVCFDAVDDPATARAC